MQIWHYDEKLLKAHISYFYCCRTFQWLTCVDIKDEETSLLDPEAIIGWLSWKSPAVFYYTKKQFQRHCCIVAYSLTQKIILQRSANTDFLVNFRV